MARRLLSKLGSDVPTPTSTRIVTPATILTVSRPVLAVVATAMLLHSSRPVLPVVIIMAVTDFEGSLARWIDRRWPASGMGSSIPGAIADKYGDVLALLVLTTGALLAPRILLIAKLAVGIILLIEVVKAYIALRQGWLYKKQTGKNLDMPASRTGKWAMAAKLLAVCAVVATNDLTTPVARYSLATVAVALALYSAAESRHAQHEYRRQFKILLRRQRT